MEKSGFELENESSESTDSDTVTLFSVECNINNLGSYKLNVHFEELYKYFAALAKDEKVSQNYDASIISKLLAKQISIFGDIANAMFKDAKLLNEMKNFTHQTVVSKNAEVPVEVNRAQSSEVPNVLNPTAVEVEFDTPKMQSVSNIALEKAVRFFPKDDKTLKFQDLLDLKIAEQKMKNNKGNNILNYNIMYEYFKGPEHITFSNKPFEEFKDVAKKYCGLTPKICGLEPQAEETHWKKLLTEESEVLEDLQTKACSSFQYAERTLSQVSRNLEHTSNRLKTYLWAVEERRTRREAWYNKFLAEHFPNGIPKPKPKE
ncbi:uncharacterized protein LOC119687568 [Teleopsis dalmanni]|uniref:uncharacterized protein LOC119687568 n=1 Tax=Teleopsis dalmanni TaxID=139649 RepID=UPI0018CE2933|nr:uncharacterized protein LOC119687568 [Teleopsis dalmanni]